MRPRQNYTWSFGIGINRQHEKFHSGADIIFFIENLLFARKNGDRSPQINKNIIHFHPLDNAADQFALLIFIFFPNRLPFGFANALDDNLLGGLGGNAAKVLMRLKRELHFIAYGNIIFYFFRFIKHYMPLFIKPDFFVLFTLRILGK